MPQPSSFSSPVALFCLAAPQDASLLAEWEMHLLPLQQTGRITCWSERHMLAGEPRLMEISRHLEQAAIIVLLLSSNFFADGECRALTEQALQRAHNGQAHVIPLLLRPVAWRETALGALSCLPNNGRPIVRWPDQDEAFLACVEDLKKLLDRPTTPTRESGNQYESEDQHTRASSQTPVVYHSCFLSYAHQDEPLAQRLYADLKAQGVACWFAPHDMKIGARIRPTLDRAIKRQEKLLLLLSQHAIASAWIEDEVEAALEYERLDHREMLFPVRLDDAVITSEQAWAAKLRRTCNIGDFTRWMEPAAYQQALARLLRDLRKADEYE